MKLQFKIALAFFSFVPVAFSCPSGSQGSCGDPSTYLQLVNLRCDSGTMFITDHGAMEIALLASQRSIHVDSFIRAFRSTCDFETSKEIGLEVAGGTLDDIAFFSNFGFQCRDGSRYITLTGALQVARESASSANHRGLYSARIFQESFFMTCNFESAVSNATEAMAGRLDFDVFKQYFGFRCAAGTTYITEIGAQQLARASALQQINRGVFNRVFSETCNYDSAYQLACGPRN